jgi:HSP20 family molecular chaperone IbpA
MLKTVKRTMRPLSPILAADIIEGQNDFTVHVDLPGVSKTNISVVVNNDSFEIRADRQQVHASTDVMNGHVGQPRYTHIVERSYGSIVRRIRIPERADPLSANATFENGVLRVMFAKLVNPRVSRTIIVKDPVQPMTDLPPPFPTAELSAGTSVTLTGRNKDDFLDVVTAGFERKRKPPQ